MQISSSALLNTIFLSLSLLTSTLASITCNQGTPNTITVNDVNNLISNLQHNNFNPPSQDPVPFADQIQSGANSITFGGVAGTTVSVTVDNNAFFHATHAKLADIASALEQWRDVCCGGFPTCISGSTTVTGDTGLLLDMQINTVSQGSSSRRRAVQWSA